MQLRENLYWTGVLDPDLRVFDIIMHTEFGTTYNAYVIQGSEKTALVETVKEKFYAEYLEKLQAVVDIKEIDYIICNHTEPDHVGSIAQLLALNPEMTIIASHTAVRFLENIINAPFKSHAVKEGELFSLGAGFTLEFMILPNLHWPDTMYTYWQEAGVLFTCDSFGSHYSHLEILRSTVTDETGYMRATKYYFDNIIGPFKQPFMQNALKRIADLQINMICTGHGPVLDDKLEALISIYHDWTNVKNPNQKKTVIIPYVSAYGYTASLAEKIAAGIKASGDIDVKLYDMVEADAAEVLAALQFADGMLFGTPTIVGDALKPIWDLTTSLFSVGCQRKPAGAFGSYGWSGEGVPNISERLKQLRMQVVDGFRVQFKPTEADFEKAFAFGKSFGEML